jgi:hypothetical protein
MTFGPARNEPVTSSAAAIPRTDSTACQPSQLYIPQPRWNGAAGTAFYLFQITNTSTSACQVGGFFGVSIYDRDGHLLEQNSPPTLPNESGPATPLLLSPGGLGHLAVSFSESGATNAPCSSIGSFHLIPPNARAQVQVQVSPTKPGPAPAS